MTGPADSADSGDFHRRPTPAPVPLFHDSREDAPPYAELDAGTLPWSWTIRVNHGTFTVRVRSHVGTRRSADRRAARLVAAAARDYEREKTSRHRVEPITAADHALVRDARVAAAEALADLRNPDAAWQREFNALDTATSPRPLQSHDDTQGE
ncbi:MAG: hypothetical protein CMH36_08030 [Microbacterium sp.]|uniref:Uncharacterized protein n=1 Tax=Microbacterium ginsengisoli TaxID=400772 RepID=A0A3C1KHE2_9MICO|nr:hypothetical protein [Microbacterium sp.]MCK9917220.1 hypothetical protein [Microbacteriaceae bacterium K1510]HAN26055.1 hypothetical protein [Microbacterium ginsengisoli]